MIFMYFLVATFGFTLFTWFFLELIRQADNSHRGDDEGGLSVENDFPIIDLPPGGTIEDLLVDRGHGDKVDINQFH